MPGVSPERVHAASAAWVWVPSSARRLETDEYLVVRYPRWWERPLQLVRLRSQRPAGVVLDEVIERAGALCDDIEPVLDCWVRLDAPGDLEPALVERGGTLDETVDVLARDLAHHEPGALAAPPGVDLRWTDDLQVLFDASDLGTAVFGGSTADRSALEAEHLGEALKYRSGGGGSVVAYVDGRAVATGGVTVAGADARLWGGAVLPGARGRGLYRAVLAARLDYAHRSGATLAIVKGRVETSAPILRRAGFAAHGQERSYLVDLRPAGS